MTTIIIDAFERPELDSLLGRWNLTVVRQNMVHLGLADFFWVGHGGVRYTLEHKQGREFVGNMGNRLDEQLRKHAQHADFCGVVIEGWITPKPGGGCEFWRKSKDGRFFHKYGKSPVGYEAVQAYIWSLTQQGFVVFQYADLMDMALGIASFCHNSQKTEHHTLDRHIKHKQIVFTPDPYVETLMGIGGDSRIGEITAKKILAETSTPYNFFTSTLQDMQKVTGRELFIRVMKAIGRRSY